jgi:hypothetical protein
MYDATWYHKFGSTWHLATEIYSMSQRDVTSVNGTLAPEKGTNGANCRFGMQTCFAPEWAALNYVNKQTSAHDFISLRTDFLNDKKGQRTGYASKYSEETFMYTHWVGTTVQIRPEVRFDHGWNRRSYDNGTRTNQFTVASDVIFHF